MKVQKTRVTNALYTGAEQERLKDARPIRMTRTASEDGLSRRTVIGPPTYSRGLPDAWEQIYRDSGESPVWSQTPIPVFPAVLAAIKARARRTVVDLGCGEGRNLLPLAEAGLICVGIDASESAIARARAGLDEHLLNAFLLLDDICALRFASHSVQAAVCFDAFGQLAHPEKAIKQIERILLPGGLLALNAYTPADCAFGKGKKLGARSFLYRKCLFRFFEKEELVHLFSGWDILTLERQAWMDSPHPEFRPYEHKHDSWLLIAARHEDF